MHHAMSKYEAFWPFFNMKSITILIVIFNFIHSVHCNNTDYTVDPLYISRPKRALEYTRWKVLDIDQEQQFIVKVLDDDEASSARTGVVGVNYPSANPAPGNLIVSGVKVPPGQSILEPSASKVEYSRFLPPYRNAGPNEDLSGENYTLPKIMDKWGFSPKLQVPDTEHEESPPASPQFLPRAYPKSSLQYVPVSLSSKHTVDDNTEDPLVLFKPNRIITRAKVTKPERVNRVPSRMQHVTRTVSRMPKIHRTSNVASEELHRAEYLKSKERTNLEDNYFDFLRMKNGLTEKSLIHPDVTSQYGKDKEIDYTSGSKKENQNFENIFDTNKAFFSLDYNYDANDKESLNNEEIKPVFNDESNAIRDIKQIINLKLDSFISEIDNEDEILENNGKNVTKTKNDILEPTTFLLSENKRRMKRIDMCSVLNIRPLSFNIIHTLPEITEILKTWTQTSPITKSVDITYGNFTTMENPIHMMIVDDPSGGQSLSAKKTVMIVAGIIARDHHSVAAAMYILHQLIEKSNKHEDLLEAYRFWIIPVLNPDGYDYSKSFPEFRNWKKNLRQNWEFCKSDKTEMKSCKSCELNGLRCFIQPCFGVNLDRNFEYQWIRGQDIEMEHPCGDLYSGQNQISEQETFALTNYLHKISIHIDTFISIKEGNVLGIMYPHSHTKKKRPRDAYFKSQATSAANAIYQLTGRTYQAGQTSEFLPLFAGGIEDWVDGHLTIDHTYSIHMYRKVDLTNGNLMEKLIPETFVAMEALLLQNRKKPTVSVTTVEIVPRATSTSAPSKVHRRVIIEKNDSSTLRCSVLVIASIIISLI